MPHRGPKVHGHVDRVIVSTASTVFSGPRAHISGCSMHFCRPDCDVDSRSFCSGGGGGDAMMQLTE